MVSIELAASARRRVGTLYHHVTDVVVEALPSAKAAAIRNLQHASGRGQVVSMAGKLLQPTSVLDAVVRAWRIRLSLPAYVFKSHG